MNKLIVERANVDLLTVDQYISLLNQREFATDFINVYNLVSNRSLSGEYVNTENNKFRIFPNASFNPLFYRGENKIYNNFSPSFLRINHDAIEHAIEWIKKIEFIELIKASPYFRYLSSEKNYSVLGCQFDIDLEAIAQHYEFATNYLDFSTDMAISMFFAYTQHIESGKYMPISDFTNFNPVLYVGDIKKLYQEKNEEKFIIIGFQPAPRPSVQKALAFEFNDKESIFRDKFTKIELPKSNDMANGIYEHFQGGEALFPKDIFSEYAERIREKYLVSEYVDLYCDKYKKDAKKIVNDLTAMGYEITSRKTTWSQNDIFSMDFEVSEKLIPWLTQNISYRGASKSCN